MQAHLQVCNEYYSLPQMLNSLDICLIPQQSLSNCAIRDLATLIPVFTVRERSMDSLPSKCAVHQLTIMLVMASNAPQDSPQSFKLSDYSSSVLVSRRFNFSGNINVHTCIYINFCPKNFSGGLTSMKLNVNEDVINKLFMNGNFPELRYKC